MDERLASQGDPQVPELPHAAAHVQPTLGDLLSNVGPGILEVAATPAGLDVEVVGPNIADPRFGGGIEAGEVVFGVGVGVGTRECADLLATAARARAAAVVLKSDRAPSLADEATRAGIAVLAISPEMGWAQCFALVRTALARTGGVPNRGATVGDLFSLANAVAAMVGGAVSIEDPHSHVLAYSSSDEPLDDARRQTILGRRIPDPWMKRLRDAGVFRDLWAGTDPVRFEYPEEGLRPRLAIAVRAGEEILGSIWVAEGSEPFGPQTEAALREAARIAALHLIRHRTTEDVERNMRADLLRNALEGRWPPEMLGARLGIPADEACAVVAFEPADDGDGAALKRERALDLITVHCEAFRRRAVCAGVGSAVYALLPMGGTTTRERLLAFAADVVRQAERGGGARLRAGVGSTVPGLRRAPDSRREADKALRVARAASMAVADIDEVRGPALLDELREIAQERPHLRTGKLERLAEHDRRHGTSYVATLRAYLNTFGDVPAAASLVQVHPNTFRYRVRRLEELSGIDLGDPRERLAAEIQLQFTPDPRTETEASD